MKEGKSVPRWPLYVADALMFLTVFVVAMPSIKYMEKMPFGETFLCCILVLGGMFLLLIPYYLDYKAEEKRKSDKDEEAEDSTKRDLEIVFGELEALRTMLLEAEEKREAQELEAQNLSDKLTLFEAGIAELRSSIQKRLKEINDSVDSVAKLSDSNESQIKSIKADIEILASKIESIIAENSALKNEFDSFKTEASSTRKSLKGAFDKLSQKLSDFAEESSKAAEAQYPEQAADATPSGMLGKALGNADGVRDSVSKFIEHSKPQAATPDSAENSGSVEKEEPKPFDGGKIEASQDSADFFESSGSEAGLSESEIITEAEPKKEDFDAPETPMLFEDLPENPPKPEKPKKGDTIILLDSIIGIGNKPYVRGEGCEDLSWDTGIPMDFVEIGKWRLVLKGVGEAAKIKFYKNDSQPSLDDDIYEIESGDTLEFSVQFHADQ